MLAIQPHKLKDIDRRTFDRGVRILGISASHHQDGASNIAATIAKQSAHQGKRTLFVSDRQTTLKAMNQNQAIDLKFDPLSRFSNHNIKELQKALTQSFDGFERVVMDLGLSSQTSSPSILKACDAVLLVCRPRSDSQTTIEKAIAHLTNQKAKLAGLVTNDEEPASLGQQMMREFAEINWMLPKGLQNFIQKKTQKI